MNTLVINIQSVLFMLSNTSSMISKVEPWDSYFLNIVPTYLWVALIVIAGLIVFLIKKNLFLGNLKPGVLKEAGKYEQYFEMLSQNFPVGIFRSSPAGSITYVNPQWCELTGLTVEQALGLYWMDSIHSEDLEKLNQSWKNTNTKGEKSLSEYRFVRKDGTVKWVIGKAVPKLDKEGNTIEYIGTITDITELKLTERALRKSEESLKQSQIVAQMGDWEQVMGESKSTWSANCFRLYGLEPNEIEPSFEYFMSRLHEDDRHLIDEGFQKIIQTKQPIEIKIRITFSNGYFKWILNKIIPHFEAGKLVRLQGINVDITPFVDNQEKLSNQKKLFETMFNAMADGVVVTNEKQEIIHANKGIEKIFGYQVRELIGGKHDLFFNSKEEFTLAQRCDKNFVLNCKSKDNRIFPADIFCTQLLDDKNNLIGNIGVIRDITNETKTLEALRKSEANYRNLFENHTVPKLIVDSVSGEIILANPAASNFYGWTADEFTSMNLSDLCEPSLADNIQVILKTLNQNRSQYEFSHRMADGFLKEVEIFVSKIEFRGNVCFHVIIHDVTSKKQAEKKLMLLNKAIDQSPLSIFITNSLGDLEYVNKKYTELTGYSNVEAIGSLPYVLEAGTHARKDYKKLWGTISSGKDWSGEILNIKKNGTAFWENVMLSPMVSGTGQITNYIGIKEDITEQRRMIQEIINAKERAEESDRLKSAFLANMSHEIRTPLNVILGYANILTSEDDLSEDDKTELTSIISKSSEELLQVINDVLDAAKLETNQIKIERKPVELQPLFAELVDHFNKKIKAENKEHIQLDLLPFKAPRTMITDDKRLFQIFSNLLNNSIKFTNEGRISFGINKIKKDKIEFIVSDTGIGIPESAESAIFAPFRQAETTITRLYGGAGLGLSITKKLLDLMGGNILFHSEKGKGTTFLFSVPMKIDQSIHQRQNAVHRN